MNEFVPFLENFVLHYRYKIQQLVFYFAFIFIIITFRITHTPLIISLAPVSF